MSAVGGVGGRRKTTRGWSIQSPLQRLQALDIGLKPRRGLCNFVAEGPTCALSVSTPMAPGLLCGSTPSAARASAARGSRVGVAFAISLRGETCHEYWDTGKNHFLTLQSCGRLGSLEWENQLEAIEGTHTWKVRRIKRQKEVFVGLTVTSISHIR